MTDSINTYQYQHNEAIENEPNFDSNFNLSSGTKEPLPVLTVSLQVGNRHGSITVAGLKCLWDSRATDRMIKLIHTKYYE